MILYSLFGFLCLVGPTFQQQGRVPPGVPPQHYQQPPPPPSQPQYQQPPQYQQQQVPVHHQQQQQYQDYPQQVPHGQGVPQYQPPPMQHMQIPQEQQQHHGEHGGHHPHAAPAPGQLLNAANMAHEKEHLAEHLSVPIDTSKMTDQELQFHYFKMHDADNNNKLDGCELIKSLIHWHGDDNNKAGEEKVLIQSDEDLETLVDPIFNDLDLDKDGFIDWTEFLKSNPAANPRL